MERRDQEDRTSVKDNFPKDVYTGPLGESISDIAETESAEEEHTNNGEAEEGDRENRPEIRNRGSILELIYGVLFEPARTFAGFAGRPPVLAAVGIVLLLNLAEALMGLFTTPQYMRGFQLPGIPLDVMRSMLPLAAIVGFLYSLTKWFFMAGLLHLLAELYGGRGSARSVFTVSGLAGLPAALMIPVQLIAALFQSSAAVTTITVLLSLAVYIWSVVLLVIGMREVHKLGTGKAVLTVFTPALVVIVLLVIGLIMFGSTISTLPELVF